MVRDIVFLVVMYGCESWTIKKDEAEEVMLLNYGAGEKNLLRILWTARRSTWSILKEINPEYSGRTNAEAEAPILWPPDAKSCFIEKDPDAGKD